MRSPVSLPKLGISEFFQLPFNVYLARKFPLPILRYYMYLWGIFYVLFSVRIFTNIITCLNFILPAKKRNIHYIIRALLGIFEHYFEKMVMAYKSLPELQQYLNARLYITNKHLLDKLHRESKGAILITGHFGAVEYLPLSLAMQGYKVSMICKFKTQSLKDALCTKAAEFGVQLIDASEPGVAFKAIRAIKQGRFLITECDEFSEWRFHKSQRVSVLGNLLPQDRTIDFFFRKAKAPTFLTLMIREKGKFNMMVEYLGDGSQHQSIAACAWNTLEKYICKYPFQWYQIKGAAKFLLENAIDATIEDKTSKNIPNKDPILRPSYT
ncbi:MAG: hypothetical protein GXO58_10005 [Thermodesulfobacteria bacterium]|nr:hypothetical protein [Thermodesulfobacteriota bacterium]